MRGVSVLGAFSILQSQGLSGLEMPPTPKSTTVGRFRPGLKEHTRVSNQWKLPGTVPPFPGTPRSAER